MASKEEKVEEYFKAELDKLGIKHYGKTQASEVSPNIGKVLAEAPSKSGGSGINYPDIMLMLNSDKLNRHIPVMIEAKGGKNKLESLDTKTGQIKQVTTYDSDSKPGAKNTHKKGDLNYNAIKDFAVNGAYHYAKVILESEDCDFDEVIFIGINGTTLDKGTNEISDPEQKAYYLSRNNKMQPKHIEELDKSWDLLKDSNLDKLIGDLDKLHLSESELEELTNQTLSDLEKAVKAIHQEIYDNQNLKSLDTTKKLYLFSGLIMAGLQTEGISRLKPEALESNSTVNNNDGQEIIRRIQDFLNEREADQQKVETIVDVLNPVFKTQSLWINRNGESLIKSIYRDVYTNIIPLLESDLQLDFTGLILNSLNDWVSISNDEQNDVVLTPRYVTNLMVKLTQTNRDSFVWDTAMGSGGFLVSAMNEMVRDARNNIQDTEELAAKIENIKKRQLLGIELRGNIFILAVLNMILMGDGSSNLRNADSHSEYTKVVDTFPANVFLLNPPYSAPGKGLNFVKEAFLQMTNGYGAVLIQENAGAGNGQPFAKEILEKNTLVASIHMPADLFSGKSSVQTAIWVFKINEPHNEKKAVTFIDFSEDGYTRTNRKKSTQAVNLRDTDHAKARYQEVVDLVLGNVPDTHYYTEENGKLIKDRITLEGDDWTFNQHLVINNKPTLADFKQTVSDYLAWEVSNLLTHNGDDSKKS